MKTCVSLLLALTALLLAVVVKASTSEDAFPTPMPLESFIPRVKRQLIYGGYPAYGGYPYGYGGFGVGYPYGGYWG